MNRDMQEDGAAVARQLMEAYIKGDDNAVIRHMTELTKLMPLGAEFWPDDRSRIPIMIGEGRLPTPEEFVLMSAERAHGRVNPNDLHATARAMKQRLEDR